MLKSYVLYERVWLHIHIDTIALVIASAQPESVERLPEHCEEKDPPVAPIWGFFWCSVNQHIWAVLS